MAVPVAHASPQLKVGNTWTITGTYSYSDAGYAGMAGNYSEIGHFTDVFKVDSIYLTSMAISEVRSTVWSSTGNGMFTNFSGGQTTTSNRRYIINSTTLDIISETISKNATGHPTSVLIDPTALVQGNTIMRTAWEPALANTTTIATNVPATVSGSVMLTLNGSPLKLWNVTYTANSAGEFTYYTGPTNTVSSPAGPETDSTLYESTYGIIAGWSTIGTFLADQCSGCNGGWTEHYVSNALLTSSNINFGT